MFILHHYSSYWFSSKYQDFAALKSVGDLPLTSSKMKLGANMGKRGCSFQIMLKERQILWNTLPRTLYRLSLLEIPFALCIPQRTGTRCFLSIKRPCASLAVAVNSSWGDCADWRVAQRTSSSPSGSLHQLGSPCHNPDSKIWTPYNNGCEKVLQKLINHQRSFTWPLSLWKKVVTEGKQCNSLPIKSTWKKQYN